MSKHFQFIQRKNVIRLSDVASIGGGYLQFYRMLLLVPPRVEVMWQSMFVDLSVSRNGHGAAHYLGDVPDSRGSLSFDLPKIKGQRGFAVTM